MGGYAARAKSGREQVSETPRGNPEKTGGSNREHFECVGDANCLPPAIQKEHRRHDWPRPATMSSDLDQHVAHVYRIQTIISPNVAELTQTVLRRRWQQLNQQPFELATFFDIRTLPIPFMVKCDRRKLPG